MDRLDIATDQRRRAGTIILLLAIVFLVAAVPAATASPAAVDQYTEDQSDGSDGSSTQLQAGGDSQTPRHEPAPGASGGGGGGGDGGEQATPVAEQPTPVAPSSEPSANVAPTSEAAATQPPASENPAATRDRAKQRSVQPPATGHSRPQAQRELQFRPDRDGGGYPLTTSVLVILLLAVLAVTAWVAIPPIRRLVANGRRSAPGRGAPARSHPVGRGDSE